MPEVPPEDWQQVEASMLVHIHTDDTFFSWCGLPYQANWGNWISEASCIPCIQAELTRGDTSIPATKRHLQERLAELTGVKP